MASSIIEYEYTSSRAERERLKRAQLGYNYEKMGVKNFGTLSLVTVFLSSSKQNFLQSVEDSHESRNGEERGRDDTG